MSQFSQWSNPDLEIIDESFSVQLDTLEMKCALQDITEIEVRKYRDRMCRINELKSCVENELRNRASRD